MFPIRPRQPYGKVIDLRPEIARKEEWAKHHWDVTKEDLDSSVAAIMPPSQSNPEALESVKGKIPRRPPLTYEGERASRTNASKQFDIERELEGLSEPALKGLAVHCREMMCERASSAFWRGIAKTAEMKREIKATEPNPDRTNGVRSMATVKNTTVSRFHNLSNEALADAIGRADAIMKAAEAELAALKDEFKSRGLAEAAGNEFSVTATEQLSGRLDTKAVKEFLGASYVRFEKAIVSTVIRFKAANRLVLAA